MEIDPDAMMEGDPALMSRPGITGFLTSHGGDVRAVSEAVAKWAAGLNPTTDTVMLGSGLEVEAKLLDVLLDKEIPTILLDLNPLRLVEGLRRKAVIEGRLLQFYIVPLLSDKAASGVLVQGRDKVYQLRNRLLLANVERLVIGTLAPHGQLAQQMKEISEVRTYTLLVP